MNVLDYYQNEPIIGLAPMDGVSDAGYRFIHKKYGNPDIVMTEFTNVIGLSRGIEQLFEDQLYHEFERPIIAQIYGSTPEDFYHAAKIIAALDFDGIDINMGCPAKNVASTGAGAALIDTPELAKKIVMETKRGVKDYFETEKLTGLGAAVKRMVESANQRRADNFDGIYKVPKNWEYHPEAREDRRKNFTVSVKTRIGYKQNVATDWMKHLTEVEPAWIGVHGRTLNQMYRGNADWDALASSVEATHIPILVNGDVTSHELMVKILKHTQGRGVLIGRGSFGNPWIFSKKDKVKQQFQITKKTIDSEYAQLSLPKDNNEFSSKIKEPKPDLEKVMQVMVEHADLHWALKNEKAFVQIRKNLAWYVKGIHNASTFRNQLVRVDNPDQVQDIVDQILEHISDE